MNGSVLSKRGHGCFFAKVMVLNLLSLCSKFGHGPVTLLENYSS